MRPLKIRVTLLSIVLALTGACSEHQDPMVPTVDEVVDVELVNYAFSPATARVAPGTTIRWTNATSSFHTVTPDGHDAWQEWQTSGMNETFEVTFDEVGTYDYYCSPHQALGMTGRVVVQ